MYLPSSSLNRAYYDVSTSVLTNLYTILYGGRNSSKSHSVFQWLIKTCYNEDANAIVYRKFGADLKTKAFSPVMNVAKLMGLEDKEHIDGIFHNFKKEILFPRGNRIFFDFADEKGKSKGLSNIRYIIIDEIDQMTREEFITITTSFRSDPKIRFIFLFNPVSEKHWLKKTFFENPTNSPTHYTNFTKTFHYTIEDNRFATPNDYINLDALKDIDINQWRVNRHGLWGSLSVDDPYYDGFNYNNHVIEDKIPFFTEYPVYVSFDFGKQDNAIAFQTFDDIDIQSDSELKAYFDNDEKHGFNCISEYQVGKAESNVSIIVDKIVERFGTNTDYFICGDVAGNGNEGVYPIYAEIANEFESLGCYDVTFMNRMKPNHKASRRVNNWIMRYFGKNFNVSLTDCPNLIEDFQKIRVDEYGGINKQAAINDDIGHLGDCFRYGSFLTQGNNFIRSNPGLASSIRSAGVNRRIEEAEYEYA